MGAGIGFVGALIGAFGGTALQLGLLTAGATYAAIRDGPEGLAYFAAGVAGGYLGNKIGKNFVAQIQERAQSNNHEAQNQIDGKNKAAVINKNQLQSQIADNNPSPPDRQNYNSADHDYIRSMENNDPYAKAEYNSRASLTTKPEPAPRGYKINLDPTNMHDFGIRSVKTGIVAAGFGELSKGAGRAILLSPFSITPQAKVFGGVLVGVGEAFSMAGKYMMVTGAGSIAGGDAISSWRQYQFFNR